MTLLWLAALAGFLLCTFDQANSSAYDKIVTHSRIRARNEGPNVCALQQVIGTKKKYFSTCRHWYQGTICGKKATVLYECCPGYMRLEGVKGCPAVAPIDNMYATLGIVGATSTQKYSDQSGLREQIEGPGSYTIFSPDNDAWEMLDPEIRDALLSNVNVELLNALHYHMIDKRMMTKDLKNGLVLKSMYNDLPVLINHYSSGIVTVNCARLIQANQISTNGVVHVIDRVITAVGNTIEDFIDSEDDLSSLRAAAIASGLLESLGKEGHYTVFAPTNDAFEKLPRGVLERIMSDKVALEALLKFHILESVQCSEAITGGAVYETLEGNTIEIGCDGDSVTVNGVKMVKRKDIVTTNGVIHLIDEVLVPDSAKQVTELVSSKQSTFSDLISEVGLLESLQADGEFTLLAPMNSAFTEEVMSMDQRILKEMLMNHVLKVKITLNELYHGQRLETLGGQELRVFIYRTSVCIENSCMVRGSKEGRNGAIHVFRQLITPAEKSTFDMLRDDGRFSVFVTLLETAGLTDILSEQGEWTVFAPTDDAFKDLSEQEMRALKSDKNALKTILLYHMNIGVLIGGGIERDVTNLLNSVQGSRILVKSANDTLLVNGVKAKESDLMATNGVVHVVTSLLYPEDIPVGDEKLLRLLQKLIKTIQFKFVRGSTFKEIPLKFKTITTIKKVESVLPGIQRTLIERGLEKKLTIKSSPEPKVVSGQVIHRVVQEPQLKFTQITSQSGGEQIEDEEALNKLIAKGQQFSKVTTTVIESEPKVTGGTEKMPKVVKVPTQRTRIPSRRQRATLVRKKIARKQ
ncbi:periostin isoform X3 [Protopterus annectens]|uniref:periostin isoform X3 n=1 Tax=Protopterus annectens TaxID=7888 RepID=UPI001CF9327A|nr:periostin isoform X3 [Protopterus annectens]